MKLVEVPVIALKNCPSLKTLNFPKEMVESLLDGRSFLYVGFSQLETAKLFYQPQYFGLNPSEIVLFNTGVEVDRGEESIEFVLLDDILEFCAEVGFFASEVINKQSYEDIK